MMAQGKTTKQNAVAKKKARVNNGILDNEVNKSDSRSTPQKRKTNDTERKSMEPKTSSKKAKEKAVEETEVNFTEDDEEVTFHVRACDNKFLEDGELSSDDEEEAMDFEMEEAGTSDANNNALIAEKGESSARSKEAETESSEKEKETDIELQSKIAGQTFQMVKDLMEKSGMFEAANLIAMQFNKEGKQNKERDSQPMRNDEKEKGQSVVGSSNSLTTIYENTVPFNKRKSEVINMSSSDEAMDTSDDLAVEQMIDNRLSQARNNLEIGVLVDKEDEKTGKRSKYVNDGQQPGCSRDNP